jgi:hypothetical protein
MRKAITNYLTPWSQALLEKPPVAHLLQNLIMFYGTQKLIINAHSSHPVTPILNQINLVYTITFYACNIHYNFVLPSMSRSP